MVISFHSLEDRIVKRFIESQQGRQIPGVPISFEEQQVSLKPIGKAVMPSPTEVAANPRARSAVMRIAERI